MIHLKSVATAILAAFAPEPFPTHRPAPALEINLRRRRSRQFREV